MTSVVIQEQTDGFCYVDGDPAEAKNTGFTGVGYANALNQSGSKIVWSVEVGSAGTYEVTVRFANGGTAARPGSLQVGDASYTVSLPATGAWTTWQTETVTVDLSAGQNTIELISTTADGLANIDYLQLSGANVAPGSCDGITPELPEDPWVTGCDGETSGLTASKIYYVSPTGSGDGSSFSSAMSFSSALSAVSAGQMILLEPGTYSIAYSGGKNTVTLSKSGTSSAPIVMTAANCGRAIFDFNWPENRWTTSKSVGFLITGSYWYLKNIDVTRAGYQGIFIGSASTSDAGLGQGQHNTIENARFYNNRNSGLEINNGGAYTTVINSDSYENYDVKVRDDGTAGQMADGFASKQLQGPGNAFYGCRAWNNSDDGYDTYDSPEKVIIENGWAFNNGINIWSSSIWSNIVDDSGNTYSVSYYGNGNGFKIGGNGVVQNNRVVNSIAFGNPGIGFDLNNNTGGQTLLNNVAYNNTSNNFELDNALASGEKHYLRNNVSLSGSNNVQNADANFNSWDSGPSASSSDFLSLDVSLAKVARNPDGTLPYTPLFRLNDGSALINAGTDVGLPFLGWAPDLGAFEKE